MIRRPDFATVGLVYAKELRETLRDRRTIMVMILFPMVVYPLMSLLLAQVMASKATKNAAYASRVAVTGPPAEAAAMRKLIERERATFVLRDTFGETDVERGRLDAVIAVGNAGQGLDPKTGRAIPAPSTTVQVLYDETREPSNQARERIDRLLAGALPAQCRPTYDVNDRSVAPGAKVGGYLLSKVLPLVVVIMVMLGAFYPAIDITAGERERGTLETILASPVDRFDLMTGKVLAVATLAAVTGMLNLVSISLTMLQGIRLMGGASDAVRIPWIRTVAALTMVGPAAFLFASVMVAVGAMARGFKEAQNLLTPIYFLCITPALIAGLGEYEMTGVALIVPAVNVTLLARAIVLGSARLGPALVVIASTLVYGGLALSLAARLYDSERLLYAEDQRLGLRAWLRSLLLGARAPDRGQNGSDPASGPGVATHRVTASDSLLLFAGACVLLFFVFFPLQSRHLEVGLLVSEWGGMLGLVAIYARVTQQRLASVLVFTRPSGRALVGAALCGLSGWIVIGLLAEWLAPAPRELIDRLRHQVAPPGGRGLAATLLLMAITPAVCEEALFRGPILRGLATRLSPLAAAAMTGVLFGLFHFDVWRFLPTALLGLMLSLIALRARSILPSMLAHGVNNGCLVTLAQLGVDEKMTTLGAASQIGIFVAASVALVAGGFLVGTDRATSSASGERPGQM